VSKAGAALKYFEDRAAFEERVKRAKLGRPPDAEHLIPVKSYRVKAHWRKAPPGYEDRHPEVEAALRSLFRGFVQGLMAKGGRK
jgi:hypothetical protein